MASAPPLAWGSVPRDLYWALGEGHPWWYSGICPGPPRDYFFNILNTQQSDYLNQIMDHAAK